MFFSTMDARESNACCGSSHSMEDRFSWIAGEYHATKILKFLSFSFFTYNPSLESAATVSIATSSVQFIQLLLLRNEGRAHSTDTALQTNTCNNAVHTKFTSWSTYQGQGHKLILCVTNFCSNFSSCLLLLLQLRAIGC